MGAKFNQKVFAEMQRFKNPDKNVWCKDEDGKCYLVRNKTKVFLSDKDQLLCTVIMTNAGSYELKYHPGWKDFENGIGEKHILEGFGKPDPTMINIIRAVQNGFHFAGKDSQGYIEIFNLSSVVCSKKEKVNDYHKIVNRLIKENNMNEDILYHPSIHNKKNLHSIIKGSPFTIIGFLKNRFNEKASEVTSLSKEFYPNKVIFAADNDGWPSHPTRWIRESNGKLNEEIVKQISKITKEN